MATENRVECSIARLTSSGTGSRAAMVPRRPGCRESIDIRREECGNSKGKQNTGAESSN
jgi:hypothetical protein